MLFFIICFFFYSYSGSMKLHQRSGGSFLGVFCMSSFPFFADCALLTEGQSYLFIFHVLTIISGYHSHAWGYIPYFRHASNSSITSKCPLRLR
jgi:hypothetical protein